MTSGGFDSRAEKIGVNCEKVSSLQISNVSLDRPVEADFNARPLSVRSIAPVPSSRTTLFAGIARLNKIHEKLAKGQRLVLKGPPGIGKTEFAIQYCQKYRNYYADRICWIQPEEQDPDIKLLEFLNCVSPSTATNDKDRLPATQIKSHWDYWKGDRLLIVVDNLKENQNIDSLLPPQREYFKCLFTSNSTLKIPTFKSLNIAPLSDLESLELLRHLIRAE